MHEFKTIEEIYNTLIRLEKIPERLYIKLGRLKGDVDFVRFALENMLKNTPWEGIKMEFIEVKPLVRCENCGFEGEVDVSNHLGFIRCPSCNSVTNVLSGNELEILMRV